MTSHAALPSVLHLESTRYRVYFSSRDKDQRSHVGYFEIDLEEPTTILEVSEDPVLVPGPLGHFDQHGVYGASVVRYRDTMRMYTIGWNKGATPPLFYASIGLAISEDGGRTFSKHGSAPIMARSDHDPCFVSAPFVLQQDDLWRMWYLSGVGWDEVDGNLRSSYNVKYAESRDGVDWRRDGRVCLGPSDPTEQNISRACVVHEDGRYSAWFSSDRGNGYRIHHATSHDGLVWERSAEGGLQPSATGWDSDAVAYPYVVNHRGQLFMFHNGNRFGLDGIGLARQR